MNKFNMMFHQIYPEYHQIINSLEKQNTTIDSQQHLSLLTLDLNFLAYYTVQQSKNTKKMKTSKKQ